MGWLFGHKTRDSLVAELTANEPRHFAKAFVPYWKAHWKTREVLAHKLVGNELWAVVRLTGEYAESETAPVTETKVETVIVLYLLDKSDDLWGYKDMAESMFPYYFGCPLSYLDMAPVANAEWREEVRKVNGEKRAVRTMKMEVGDTLVLVEGCKPDRVTVATVRPLVATGAGGTKFKVPRKLIARVEKPAVA